MHEGRCADFVDRLEALPWLADVDRELLDLVGCQGVGELAHKSHWKKWICRLLAQM
jgi:hypothetical protein